MISVLFNKSRQDPRLQEMEKLDPERLQAENLYFADIAVFGYDSIKSPLWKAWAPRANARGPSCADRGGKDLCERGSWEGVGFRGRVRASALYGLMFVHSNR